MRSYTWYRLHSGRNKIEGITVMIYFFVFGIVCVLVGIIGLLKEARVEGINIQVGVCPQDVFLLTVILGGSLLLVGVFMLWEQFALGAGIDLFYGLE